MRKIVVLCAGVAAFVLVCGVPLQGQNTVANPFFSTQDLQHWSGEDPTYNVYPGPAALGMDFLCLEKFPGAPLNNGAITQNVHLIAGYNYLFSANIAAQYCSS